MSRILGGSVYTSIKVQWEVIRFLIRILSLVWGLRLGREQKWERQLGHLVSIIPGERMIYNDFKLEIPKSQNIF